MKTNNENGMALLLVLIVTTLIIGIVSAMSLRTLDDNNQTSNTVGLTKASEGADSGLELAADQLWGQFTGSTLTAFDVFVPMLPGQTVNLLAAPVVLADGTTINSVLATRDPNGQDFTLASTATFGNISRTAVSNVRVGGSPFGGFGYAVLANNVNCIMCHAEFDTVERANNTDPLQYGSFDRLKIASLESLLVRVGSADSSIAGTYYTRGTITDKAGAPLADLNGSGVTGKTFDANGKLVQDASGNMSSHELDLASTDPGTGLYDPNGYLYSNYPTTEAEMTDGSLPTSFPPVIPDANGDRIVNGTEFTDFKSTMTPGTATGGTIHGVAAGGSYAGASLPSSGNSAATDLLSTGEYDGNVFLVGTPGDPIVLDGPIFVDGDVVIQGTIEGTGQVIASGNIYFTGDATYNDGSTFGETTSGDKNLVAYAAGGNILIGDYLSQKKVGKTSVDVQAASYLDANTIDQGGPANSGGAASFTSSEISLFNKNEYLKWQGDSSYVPRYYQIDSDAPAYWFDNPAKEHGSKYDSTFKEITAAEIAASNAAVLDLGPDADWVSEAFLKNVWQEAELARPAEGSPFEIDGLLYTNNAIMALARSNKKHNSRTFGQLKVSGGMVGADLGILASGNGNKPTAQQAQIFGLTDSGATRGFVMLYDQRVDGFLSIEDVGNLSYTKRVRVFL